MKIIRILLIIIYPHTFILLSLFWTLSTVKVVAKSAVDGLFICDDGSSVKNIVAATQKKNLSGRCVPYQKDALGENPTFLTTEAFSSSNISSSAALILPQNISSGNPVKIYFCPDSQGGKTIESDKAPHDSCQLMGSKIHTLSIPNILSQRTAKRTAEDNTISATTDIYKCFDANARPSYVSSDQIKNFHHCNFFSHSLSKVKQQFVQESRTPKTLADLAIEAVGNKKNSLEAVYTAGVQCVGAGRISFNGNSRDYNCATRSFDYTPGSSGGVIILGNKRADISAHRLDYFNINGSCGGTVTATSGRILHLNPTKDCPTDVIIQAQKIAQTYIKTISATISDEFLKRQRMLATQINNIADIVGVDPFLVHAIISAESAYKSWAVSSAGAQGLMQLIPTTARRFGVFDSFHTGENIRGGTTYLRWLLNEFNNDMQLAIAAYNAGEGNVRKYGYKIPPFIETQAYVPKVLEYYHRYKNNPALIGLK